MIDLRGYSVLLLASGLSRRFGGGSKLMAQFDGLPLAAHAGRCIMEAGFGRSCAVVAAQDDAVAVLLQGMGLELERNPEPLCGQGASLALGASFYLGRPPRDGLFVLLADMPRVVLEDLSALAAVFEREEADIAVSHNGYTPVPPAVFRPSLLSELAQLSGDKGAKTLFETHNTIEVPLAPSHLIDLDVRGDFLRYQTK